MLVHVDGLGSKETVVFDGPKKKYSRTIHLLSFPRELHVYRR